MNFSLDHALAARSPGADTISFVNGQSGGIMLTNIFGAGENQAVKSENKRLSARP